MDKINLSRQRKLLNFATAVIALIISLTASNYYVRTCNKNVYYGYAHPLLHAKAIEQIQEQWQLNINEPTKQLLSILSIILAIFFVVASSLLLFQLKRYFPEFYAQYSCLMTTAVVFQVLPLFFRTIMDQITRLDSVTNYLYKVQKRLTIYNSVFFIVATYLPVICQMATLIFGFVRYKQSN